MSDSPIQCKFHLLPISTYKQRPNQLVLFPRQDCSIPSPCHCSSTPCTILALGSGFVSSKEVVTAHSEGAAGNSLLVRQDDTPFFATDTCTEQPKKSVFSGKKGDISPPPPKLLLHCVLLPLLCPCWGQGRRGAQCGDGRGERRVRYPPVSILVSSPGSIRVLCPSCPPIITLLLTCNHWAYGERDT